MPSASPHCTSVLSQVRQSARCAALLSQRGRATWLSASSHYTKGKKAMVG